jgi:hypothetical protein
MRLICNIVLAGTLLYPAIGTFAQTRTNVIDTISKVNELKEVVVKGYGAERNLKAAEMGRVTISEKMIMNIPVLFGEPDIVKTLQTQPGVSQGIEGFTGLFVRGGDNDQNLFLYQGLPLYHVSHLGGIFSSFNAATVSRVDFYKAAFPSKYGSRISSITDVMMKQPDFEEFHGRFNVGLLSANAYISGPIVNDKTAFSVGLRRSWLDLVSIPTLAIVNAIEKKNGKKHIAGYNFTDFNARLDHIFNSSISAYVIGYYGHDNLKIGLREFEGENNSYIVGTDGKPTIDNSTAETRFFDENTNKLSWGNWGVLGTFAYRPCVGLLNVSAYYTSYSSKYRQEREYQNDMDDSSTYGYSRNITRNGINDFGLQANYLAEFSKAYKLQTGIGFVHHNYLPEGLTEDILESEEYTYDSNGDPHINAKEGYIYIDNTLNLMDMVSISAGLRSSLYRIQSQTFKRFEPRLSARVSLTDRYSVKASFARMTQYVQQISSNYINLPTDLWQPITAQFEPLKSDQYSIGFYGTIPTDMYFSVEGWYKDMKNLLEYREGVSVLNPDLSWDEKLTSGKGWSYGVDFSLTKEMGRLSGTVGYGLMWNWRKFSELNQGLKFPAKFDNRHKININVNYKLNNKIEFNAGWIYMTGNRLTLSMYNYDIPGSQFPDAPTVGPPGYGNENDGIDYYPERNNVRMPSYHRLDLGMNIYHIYKHGQKGIWNISLYNAYCRMNPITIQKDNENNVIDNPDKTNWHRAFKSLSFIPIIPSISYTYIF